DESCGQGRIRRPENFTTRAASQRLSKLVRVASTAAAGGIVLTRISISLSVPADAPGDGSLLTRRTVLSASRSPARKVSASSPKFGMAAITIMAPTAAAHKTSLPGGYHSIETPFCGSPAAAATGRESKARYPSHQAGKPALAAKASRKTEPNTKPRPSAPESAAVAAAQ